MKEKFQILYNTLAHEVAKMSYARRLKVGAVIVKDNRVISLGYNGMPAGWENNCEDRVWDPGAGGWLDPAEFDELYPYEAWHEDAGRTVRYGLKTKAEVLHAESNAVSKLAKSNDSGDGADIFITHAPCLDCAKLIHQSGIRRVWYSEEYRSTAGLDFLSKSGILVQKINNQEPQS